MTIKRHGGMTFWQVGRFGGTFYRKAKPKPGRALVVYKPPFWTQRRKELATDAAFMVAIIAVWTPIILGL